jgi:hypothetical protein
VDFGIWRGDDQGHVETDPLIIERNSRTVLKRP